MPQASKTPRASSTDAAILQVLRPELRHLTSKQIHTAVRKQLPAISLVTVYRALERLARTGKVSISDMGAGAVVYARVTDPLHHHLICQDCGGIVTIEHAEVGRWFAALGRRHGFKVTTNHLVLFGLCAGCQATHR